MVYYAVILLLLLKMKWRFLTECRGGQIQHAKKNTFLSSHKSCWYDYSNIVWRRWKCKNDLLFTNFHFHCFLCFAKKQRFCFQKNTVTKCYAIAIVFHCFAIFFCNQVSFIVVIQFCLKRQRKSNAFAFKQDTRATYLACCVNKVKLYVLICPLGNTLPIPYTMFLYISTFNAHSHRDAIGINNKSMHE